MGFQAGSVNVLLGGTFNPAAFAAFDKAVKKSAATMEATEVAIANSGKRVDGHMRSIGVAAKAGGLAVATGFIGLGGIFVKSAMEAQKFEASMRNVNTIAKVSEKQLQSMGKEVLKLAADTGQAPKVLADGLYSIVSSGFEAKDALTVLQASAKAASAGLTDTETAAGAVSAVLNAYKLPASEAARVSDQLFQTVNRGVITFEELARNIGDVLPFAAPLNVGLDQVGAALSTITKNGVPAAQAATQIKGVFSQLLSPSEALAAAVKKTGASSAESLVKTKGFQGALNALVGTTDGSKAALSELFPNVEALSAALNLTGQNARGAEADLRALQNSAGQTDAAFQEQSKSFEVQSQRFSAALNAAFITIGQELLPKLTPKLKEISDAIANGIDDGSIAEAAQDVISVLADLGQAAMDGFRGAAKGAEVFLGVLTTISDGVVTAAKAFNALPGPDIDTSELEQSIDRVNEQREGLRKLFERPERLRVQAVADIDEARAALRDIRGTKLEPKVMRVLGSDRDAKSKLRSLIAIGIPAKQARVLAAVGDALAGVRSVQGAMNALQAQKTIFIDIVQRGGLSNALRTSPNRVTSRPRRASGRGPIGAEEALVGEGRVPREYVIDPGTGMGAVVDAPTLMNLPAGAYVIPVDPGMRAGSMGLFGDLARELGVPGFARGRKPKKKKAKRPAYKVPDRIALGGVPYEDVEGGYKQAREGYQTARKDVKDSEAKLSDLRQRLARAKGDAAKRSARQAIRDEEKRLRGRRALMNRRERPYRKAEADWKAAKATNDQALDLESEANLAGDAMSDAAKRNDPGAFNAARSRRTASLRALIKMLQQALRLANPKSAYARQLRERISKLGGNAAVAGGVPDGGDLLDAEIAETPEAAAEVASPFDDAGLTEAERRELAGLEASKSLAVLTASLEDDKAAAASLSGFFDRMLGAALSDPARGGAPVIKGFADQLAQARSELESITSGRGTVENQDLQAQLDQANERARIATLENQANIAALATFGSPGDIGTGRFRNARDAGAQIVINTLHPGDPRTLAAIGSAAAGGFDLQGTSPNPPLVTGY